MNDKDNIQKELESLSPFLAEMKQQELGDGYQVPFDYFDNLTEQVMETVKVTPRPVVNDEKPPSWLDKIAIAFQQLIQPKYAMGFATIALLIVAVFYLIPAAPAETTAEIALNDIPIEDIQGYIADNLEDFNEEMLLENGLTGDLENDAALGLDVEDEALEEYLDDIIEDIDLNTLEDIL